LAFFETVCQNQDDLAIWPMFGLFQILKEIGFAAISAKVCYIIYEISKFN
jgi:hypothetical protein